MHACANAWAHACMHVQMSACLHFCMSARRCREQYIGVWSGISGCICGCVGGSPGLQALLLRRIAPNEYEASRHLRRSGISYLDAPSRTHAYMHAYMHAYACICIRMHACMHAWVRRCLCPAVACVCTCACAHARSLAAACLCACTRIRPVHIVTKNPQTNYSLSLNFSSGRFPKDLGIPPLKIETLTESNPLKSRFLVCGLALA